MRTYLQDWEFHQATGMVAAQIGTHDMNEAALWLVAASAEIDESPHDTAMRVIERRLRLGQGGGYGPSRRTDGQPRSWL